jgi:hypothetical protein
VPDAITQLIASAMQASGARRLVLAGRSTGAHPALVQAMRFNDCICVVCNPISHISAYSTFAVRRFLSVCWGLEIEGNRKAKAMPREIIDDCSDLYHEGHSHTLILLQNATDHHLKRQCLRLAVRVKDSARMLLTTRYFPASLGHTYPNSEQASWIAAAVTAPGATCMEVGDRQAQMVRAEVVPQNPVSAQPKVSATPVGDLELAARLAALSR